MSSPRIELLAPAKVNLFLNVIGRRSDGLHLLESLIVPVDLFDSLVLDLSSSSDGIVVETDSPDAPGGPTNLVYKAASLFLAEAGVSRPVRISLKKRIPVGSGLGGGSSDAAAVLRGLNWVFDKPFKPEALATLGAKLGADVPVFVFGRPAFVSGIGEIVCPVDLAAEMSLVLASDLHGLSTAAVYSKLQRTLTRTPSRTSKPAFVRGFMAPSDLVNDLEEPALELHTGIASLKHRLLSLGAQGSMMSGSGSAVFGMFPDFQIAKMAAKKLRAEGIWSTAVRTLNRIPMEA